MCFGKVLFFRWPPNKHSESLTVTQHRAHTGFVDLLACTRQLLIQQGVASTMYNVNPTLPSNSGCSFAPWLFREAHAGK